MDGSSRTERSIELKYSKGDIMETIMSFAAIQAVVAKQKAYEASYSLSGFRNEIKEVLKEFDFSTLTLDSYRSSIPDMEHASYHKSILDNKISMEKVFSVVIEAVTMNHSYLEHRILGYKIGQKVCPKKVVIDGQTKRASVSTKLTLGANIVQFLKTKGFLQNRIVSGDNKHTHNIVEPTSNFMNFMQEAGLYHAAARVRSGGAGYRMMPHSSERAGGNYLTPKTMLKGVNLQSQSACQALNKCQEVVFRLIPDDKLIPLLEEYKQQDKWYDKDGVFMDKEWNKLIVDILRFKDQDIHIPFAFEDSSGRMHSRSPYINPQGDSFQKAMLTIDGEEIHKYDCRNNNLQVYALLGSDEKVGARVGLVAKELEDLRNALAARLNNWIQKDVFIKDTVKHLVMIMYYGGMEKQLLDTLSTIQDDERYAGKCTIRDLVPEDKKEGLYKFITDVMEELAPAAMKLMNLIYRFNDENQTRYTWTMPDGFVVDYETTQVFTNKGYYIDIAEEETHSVSIEAQLPYNTKFSRSLAPNIVRSVESYIAREVVRRADFPISLVHDSYGVKECDVPTVNQLVKEVMADVNEMNLLHDILTQINPKKGFRVTRDGLTREMIMAGSPLSKE